MLVLFDDLGNEIKTTIWKFPGGEIGVRVNESPLTDSVEIRCDFRSSDDIIGIVLLVDAIRSMGIREIGLVIPYFPYARQDRVMVPGESHSVKAIANIINSCKFNTVEIADPHSDVTTSLIENVVVKSQSDIAYWHVRGSCDILLAPDAGALKKIYPLAAKLGVDVVCATKIRDISTGQISGIKVYAEDNEKLKDKRVWVVDDICDGGKTFIELAKVISGYETLNLFVTHGIFSKGLDELNQYYATIKTYNDMRL